VLSYVKKRADPVPEAPTRVGSGEGNNRSKVLPPQKFCRETCSPTLFDKKNVITINN
jgi:hypothetical protein